ncbi:restriction endonuclease [Qipengyuania sp. 1NDW9]|uniref:restriction endonuclease n=1 Tax=Qipengyuania xiapuensis TaxID=2867236 RepID=UPI001C882800|nr:restriction endonuclease [Qipengyuania xiapuensis]MBX7492034.1 restriction endonuclease [Qipengyuania xiapuensis]
MTKTWGVHMPEWVGDDPIEGGFVVIGWGRLGNIFEIPNDREEFKRRLERAYPEKKPGAIPVDAGTLFRFAHEIAEGDTIVYPSKHNRMVNIGKATGKRWHGPPLQDGEDTFPNYLGVEWRVSFPRSEFSQAALNEIGSFISLFRIRQHTSEFLKRLGEGHSDGRSASDQSDAVTDDIASQSASKLAEETTQDFVIRRIHQSLTGFEFEHFSAHLMECLGYTARVTEKTGDGGVDIIAHTDQLGFQPPIIKVQCKRQTAQVGEPEVSQLLGTLGEGEFALFVTLGSYTRQARSRERNTPRLRLLDGEDLVELILEHYPQMSPRYRTMLPLKQIYVPDIISD